MEGEILPEKYNETELSTFDVITRFHYMAFDALTKMQQSIDNPSVG